MDSQHAVAYVLFFALFAMSRFVFVHAADLHLDTPFEDVGRAPPAVAAALRDASLEAWDNLVELTLEREAVCLLLAGDIYDGDERGIRGQVRLRDGLATLTARGVQVCIAQGNHDPLEGWSAIDAWVPGVTVFEPGAVTSVPIMAAGVEVATVHGISYGRRDCAENLVPLFQRGPQPGLQIGLLHANVGGNPAHLPCSPCTVGDLHAAGLDYWALGHVHQRAYLGTGAPWIVYPGTLQGRRRATGELGAKGAVVVEVEDGIVRQVTFAPADRVRYVDVEIEASQAPDDAALVRALLAQTETVRAAHAGRGLLLDAVLTGTGGAGVEERGARLLAELRRHCAAYTPFVWWARMRDARRSPRDRAALRQRTDFTAAVLQRAEELERDPAARARFVEQRCEPLLRKWVAEVEADEVPELLRAAEDLALDLLLSRDGDV